MITDFLIYLALCYVIYFSAVRVSKYMSRRPYPPGPRGIPFLGNVMFPGHEAHKTFVAMGQTYGSDIIHLNVLGTHLVILNTVDAARALLEKKSAIYSDRSVSGMTMLLDLCGLGWAFVFLPYGAMWRECRKAFQREFHVNAVKRFRPIELHHSRKLLHRLLHSPDRFLEHLKQLVGSEITAITYGIEIEDNNDPWLTAAENAMTAVQACLHPGTFLVDLIPILKYVPDWVPGAGFKRKARIWRQWCTALRDGPWEFVQKKCDESPESVPDCVAKSLIENDVERAENKAYADSVGRSTTGTMYLGGTDTTASALSWILLAMVLHTDVQQRAQEEIDGICGSRLPDFEDYDALPYVHAIVMEALRWNPVSNLNIPHRSSEDDVYETYLIPKGSLVIANHWAMLHDPSVYSSPEAFLPERFLKSAGPDDPRLVLDSSTPDPMDIGFGFGRRICPGRHMAYESLWIAVASILAVFNITPAKDELGKPILPSGNSKGGFTSCPEPFVCTITPRSAAHAALILQMTS